MEIVILFTDLDAGEADRSEAIRQAKLEKAWAFSDKAIAEGMETWDIDRVNAEIHDRRYGDRERYRILSYTESGVVISLDAPTVPCA